MKKTTLVRLALASAGAAAMIAVIPNALAFRMIQNTTVGRVSAGAAVACNAAGGFAHWLTANIPWRLNTSGQGAGKDAALTAAAASWTNVSGANRARKSLWRCSAQSSSWKLPSLRLLQIAFHSSYWVTESTPEPSTNAP